MKSGERRALNIAQAGAGPDNPDVAKALYTVAEVHVDENQLAKAEPLCREALEIQQRTLPPDDPTLGHSFHLMPISTLCNLRLTNIAK
jgi:hypothetical protein